MDNSGGNMFFLTGFWRRLSSAFLAFAIVLATIPVTIPIAFAATVTWDGDGGDSVWSTCTNWSGNSCPGSGDDALIDTAVTVKLTAATTINSLTLGVSAGNVASVLSFDYDAIGGSPLTVNGNVTMYGSSKITHTDNTSATSYRANLDINGSFTLNSVASIDVRAKGFTGGATDTNGNGTSPGTWNTYTGGGGAHAGTGGRSACSSSNNGGASPYGSSNNPVTIGSGGSGGTDAGAVGGDGGGAVKIDVAGTFTLNGTISADGANGSASNANTNAGGGGAGGSVQVIASTLSGSGTIDADGGNGGNGAHRDGGGGGAGRILIRYTSTTIATSSFNTMVGALGGSVDTTFNQCASPLPVAGQNGSAIILDLASDLTNFTDADAYIIDGYRFESGEENSNSGTRFRFNNITVLGTATSGTGLAAIRNNTTASIVDADGTLKLSNAAWTCSSVTTLQVDAATLALDNETSDDVFTLTSCGTWTLNVTSSITSTLDNLTISTTAIDWNVPASTTLTLSDSTITTTAKTNTAFTIDDAITLNLGTADNTNASTVTSNATLAISAMTIYAGSTWSSNALGCAAGSGGTAASGPNGSNVCATSTTGYGRDGSYAGGGGGHGGAGGASVDGTASSTYDTATDPTTYRLGSGGARGESVAGGVGGGFIKLDISGTFTVKGSITANGSTGANGTNNGGGGGSGGSIWVIAGTIAGSGATITANGAAGASGNDRGGGGGGGGLVYLSYGVDSSSWRSGLSSANTTGGGAGGDDIGGPNDGTAGSGGTLTQVDVPVFSSALYKDSDANGVVDQVVITFDESVSLGGTVASTRFTWTSASGANGFAGTLSGNASASGTDVTITIGSADANETGHTTVPTIAYNDNSDDGTNKIQDTDGNIVQTFTAQNVSDGAKPAFVSAATTSTTTVRLTMSEAVSSVTFGAAGGWTATGLTPSAVAINSDTTKLDLTVSAVNQGYTASNFAFTSGVSGSAISDAASNATASFTSKSITDGVAPDAPGSFTRSTGSGTTATFTWTVTPDTNFNHYEIWYGTNSTHVTNRNNTASEWDNDPNDATLATRTTTTTTVTGLTAGSTYYALICAVDNASNETCTSSISFVTNQAPTAATVTGSEATDGTGNVTVSFIMDDPDDDNTLQALVEYSTNGGTSWSKATLSIVDADTTATYGTPRVDNSATYQVGKASNYITSSSGANTVTVKWPSSTDAPTANISNAKIRVTPYDGVAAGTAATSSDFTLDNVDPSNPTVDSSTTVSGPGLTFDTTITGTKDANTAIRNNGTQVVELDSNTTWSYNVRLATGDNVYSFTAIDAKGNESSATSHTIVYTRQDGAVVIRRGGNSKSSDDINSTPDDKKVEEVKPVEAVESTLAPQEPQQPPADPEDAKKKLLDAASVVVDTINGAMKEDVGTLIEKAEEAEEEEKEKKKIEEPSFEIVTVAVDEKPIEILATREKMLETEDYQKITPVDEAGIPVWIQQKFSKEEKAITKDSDLDGDNILDMEEILLGTKLDSKDSDGDGISDDKEITQGINPTAWDTDHDGVSDRNEALHGTNPKNPDSDNDGFLDMEEISAGSDPKDNKDKPHLNKQGIPEEWVNKYGDWKEVKYNKPQKIRGIEKEVTMSFAMMDMDGDGLTDENEYRLGTNPTHEDTDRDGVPDGTEVHDYKTDPTRDTETELLYSTKASNLKPQGNAFAGTPVVRGIAQPNSTVEVIFLPSQKEKSPTAWMLFASSFGVDTNGIITELIQTDSIGKFLISPKVKDGDYIVVIRSLDTNGAIIEESLPYEVKIDSSLSLLAEKIVIPLQLDTKAIDIENLQLITIDNNRPYLYGTAKKGYEVIISWKSQLYTSSLVVDTDEGEFVTLAPADLDFGEHSLYIYAVEPAKNLSTPPITINFNILDLDADFNILSTASIFTDWKLLARVGIPLFLILILSLILIRVKFRGKIL